MTTPPAPAAAAPIDRASAADLMQLAVDYGPATAQVAAVLVCGPGPPLDLAAARQALDARSIAVPRLRQRLVATPWGCGRPVWVDDPDFAIARHVGAVRCPAPGDERALLDLAATIATTRLPPGRPPWSITVVTGLADDRTALVVVFHHVLADGIGGLAVLAGLMDGAPAPPRAWHPRPAPSRRALRRDALAAATRAARRAGRAPGRLRAATAELRPGRTPPGARCSLNAPTGRRRTLAVVRADLAAVSAAAHACGGTVNDVVLTAVTGALRDALAGRGETVPSLTVSMPVSARASATGTRLGNRVGIRPVALPLAGQPLDRLRATAHLTRAGRSGARGASAGLLVPAIRLLAAAHLARWLINHQRLVHTFVTNLRGPAQRLSFLGAPVTDIVAVGATNGNVTVAFAVLSYAGTLALTVVADPDRWPDLPRLTAALQRELDALSGLTPDAATAPPAAGPARAAGRGAPPAPAPGWP